MQKQAVIPELKAFLNWQYNSIIIYIMYTY